MPGILCEHCTAVCCKYIAVAIDTPTTLRELDDLRWFLMHENVSIFVEDGDWYIHFNTTCRHLQSDNRCGVYTTRPRICREYSTDSCDYHSGDYGWEYHFACPEHLDEYRRTEFKERQARTTRRGRVRKHHGRGIKRQKSRLRAKLPLRRRGPEAPPTTDLRGVSLPVLGAFAAASAQPEPEAQARFGATRVE